jgi:all-trans-retinol 13,14-reductase
MNDSKQSRNSLSNQHYDIILIGSGMGALTIASIMAQLRNKKVLVLERHFKAGGFTHTFKRQHFQWDVGLHYIGSMGEDRAERALMDLITEGRVQWQRFPEPMEVAVFPEFRFPIFGDQQRYQADLIEKFPDEAAAIRQFFRDLDRVYHLGYPAHEMKLSRVFPMPLIGKIQGLFARSYVHWTVKDYLDRHFKSPALKAILTARWGDVGLPPGVCAFPIFATVMNHYSGGGYYPVGGAGRIADSVQEIVEEQGGRFLLHREVTQILIDNNRAVGVSVRNVNASVETVEEYFAPVIISDAGAATTYLKLLPPDYPIPFRDALQQFVTGTEPATEVSMYVGLSQDPRILGVQGENYWIYDSFDHDQTYQRRSEWVKTNKPPQVYVAFPSLHDPQATHHTATILSWTDYSSFAQWRNQPWLHRDPNYQALKEQLMDALIQKVDRHLPGFANLVEYKELSTPITSEHFTGHYHGGIYGLPAATERFRKKNLDWTCPTSIVPGLYLTGVDVYCLGIVGAMMSARFTLSELPDGMFPPQLDAIAKARKQTDVSPLQSVVKV